MTFSTSRRSLIKAALVWPAVGLVGCGGGESTSVARTEPLFLSAQELAFVDAATRRLIPDEEDGLGAGGAHVAAFIDRQLAGPYGRAERWYMQGPWADGIPQQGYQLKLTPAELYRAAIHDVNAWCQQQQARAFVSMAGDDQDHVLHGMESGDIELAQVPAKAYFQMLWENTVEGFLADPMYGGNYGFAGWKLIGFPGPRYNYVNDIEQYGKPYTMPTVGILGRDGSLTRGA
ncbi:MAG: gluconate 2-dehydrogenase subunit 3 family protein [Pseudomonadota bacterium]|nr:gluconate 2-dehydrogenase subunit 3 family protein [Pseudomonadota bacterium]